MRRRPVGVYLAYRGAFQKFSKPLAMDQPATVRDGMGEVWDHLPMRIAHDLQSVRVNVDSPRLDIKPKDALGPEY